MTNKEIKKEVELYRAVSKLAEDKLKELRRECKHKGTKKRGVFRFCKICGEWLNPDGPYN